MENKHFKIFVCALIAILALGMSTMTFLAHAQIRDIEVKSVELNNSSIGKGYDLNITVTVANNGEPTESFAVTVYANGTEVADPQNVVDLASSSTAILNFTWKTTDWNLDNYTVYAYAELLLGDTNPDNNNCTGGNVWIMFTGDINNDGKVDMNDVMGVIQAFNSYPGQTKWNSYADIDASRRVTMRDLVIVLINFNKHL